ncbi:mitochondrial carrier homolog 2 isoform X1 [Stegostoma tigrinum]|uniref:mitochondrial carrier homolog 2 isoform X1 n=2 Tax=Stegostoma tigrinum TaxID=3053191 RepID=UPI00202B40EA|nr:mitochondrial carrier homolog 2 isoform X1 [Stegostoma tigrinum]
MMADTRSQLYLGAGLTVFSHPLMYVKLLIQVGHEPIAPVMGRNIFRRPVLQLPGLFTYAKHIVSIDGKRGLFKGLTPRLCAGTIGTIVHGKVLQSYQEMKENECTEMEKTGQEPSLHHVVEETMREMIARSTATIVTHPFHVITLRCMVQFIGRETKYGGLFGSIVTIYKEEGVFGFFAGLFPRLLGDVISLWLCNMLAYLINTYALEPPSQGSHIGELRSYSQAVTGFLASMLTYPFVLVSNLMAVNNCGLAGGLPPYAAVYSSWIDCWHQLSQEGNLSRGNSLFFRKAPAGRMYAVEQKRFV